MTEHFFQLNTKLPPQILHKYVNYHLNLPILGHFHPHNTNTLTHFIYHSNNRNHFFFFKNKQQALQNLHNIT
ncbi:DUF4180 domain-containing protein [Paenibacillus xylanexedens]|uniref:DUF4180 domain-containing protein n=1 Tax=Paenibacillus xylanexedens TaxID=528191 RepID=UPI0034D97CA5